MFAPILDTLEIRNDSSGQGHFHASRGARLHYGNDFLTKKGDNVYTPEDGKITKYGFPYAGDSKYRYIEILSDSGFTYRLMYATLETSLKVGQRVSKGQKIGVSQSIKEKYGGTMLDHIHFEIKKGTNYLNPENEYLPFLIKKKTDNFMLVILIIAAFLFRKQIFNR